MRDDQAAAAVRAPDLGSPGWSGRICDEAAGDFAAWRGGDRAGLERLVRRLTPVLWHVVRAYGLDRSTAEDVVQTTWAALVRAAGSIQDGQAVVRWLTVTARREAWRCLRARDREEAVEDEDLDLRGPRSEAAETAVLREVSNHTLWAAVARLSARCQRLLRIVAFSERPDYGAIARDLEMPVGSIGPTRGRCLAKLRSLLGTQEEWRTV